MTTIEKLMEVRKEVFNIKPETAAINCYLIAARQCIDNAIYQLEEAETCQRIDDMVEGGECKD